jgi:cytochrome c-type biogenesis protein
VSATAYGLAFGGGVASFLSPCVLPLVPAYLSLTAGARVAGGPAAALRAGGLFVAGFSAVFVALGLSASALGAALARAHVPISRLGGLAVLALAVVMVLTALGAGRLAGRELRFHPPPARYGVWAAPIAGAAFGFGWTPCIGPILGSILVVAADQDRPGRGALLLAVYAAGLAVPFLGTAVALDRSAATLRFARRHSALSLAASATVLGGYGVLLATDRLTTLTVQLQHGATALGLDRLVGLG